MSSVKAIYAGCRALGLDEETRRDLYERVTARRRLREMSPRDKQAVVDELRRLGFRPGPGGSGARRLDGPYAPKLRALWIAAWNLGLTRSRTDAALLAFVKRQTGLDHTRFLREQADAMRVIEGLKAWLARDGGVDWSPLNGCAAWMRTPEGRVAFAQFRRGPWQGCFLEALREVLGDAAADPARLDKPEWHDAMNAMGAAIRAARG
ncbi:MAG: GemA protein [Alphaproteobacteria bacterium HGW-Alphaproteobacteria-2]|nr:MAG: GemA protein [Alphaproteobacteria bacterium HGW-Alphaproteobacteria-2]